MTKDIKQTEEAFRILCEDHRIEKDETYGSIYLTIRYWFYLGHEIGKKQGHENGYREGKEIGYDKGYSEGRREGYHEGRYPLYDPDPFSG